MKKQAMMALAMLMLSLLVSLAVTSVSAQSSAHFMRIRIPFEFAIGNQTLAPGDYIIKRSVSDKPEMLLIRSVEGDSGGYVVTTNVQSKTRQSESKLVFHQYKDKYFLSQVWTAGDSAGRQLPQSGRERAVASELAKTTVEQQTVTLIARRR
jgi:hypothetical protein